MSNNKSPIDLSQTDYSPLENQLSQFLGLKVMLVDAHTEKNSLSSARSQLSHDHSLDFNEAVGNQKFEAREKSILAALRIRIAERDIALGSSLSDNELRSLLKVDHVTKRSSNADPAQAVLVMDHPHSGIYPSETERVIARTLSDTFKNGWDAYKDDVPAFIKGTSFIENFDIKVDEYRAYTMLTRVLFALRHQDHYSNSLAGYGCPTHLRLSAPYHIKEPDLYEETWMLPFQQGIDRHIIDNRVHTYGIGISDEKFMGSLRKLRAVNSLIYNAIDSMPAATFAHIRDEFNVTAETVVRSQTRLRARLEAALGDHRGIDNPQRNDRAIDDWRVLFPLFREVYAKDTSTGAERKYLDMIMSGLQTYFPTITNAPVPDLGKDSPEPPRSLAGYKGDAAPPAVTPPKPAA